MKNETNKSTDSKVGSANETNTLEANVRSAVAHGRDVQEAVRSLTLKAMSADGIDLKSLRRTMTAVLHGARDGVQPELHQTAAQTQAARALISDAVNGLDLALAQLAEASKLAVEEAAGRAQKFSSEDLARARADLESLEDALTGDAPKAVELPVLDQRQELEVAQAAVRQGMITQAQLRECLSKQLDEITKVRRKDAAPKTPEPKPKRSLMEILLEKGYLSRPQIAQLISGQNRAD